MNLIKFIIIAWLCPIAFSVVITSYTPNPHIPKDDYPNDTFIPKSVEFNNSDTIKKNNLFELKIINPKDQAFIFRKNESKPVEELYNAIPKDKELKVIYMNYMDNNSILGLIGENEKVYLSFEDNMEVFASRRNIIYAISGIWLIGFNLGFYIFRKQALKPANEKHVVFDREGKDKTSFKPFILDDDRKGESKALHIRFQDWSWFHEQFKAEVLDGFQANGTSLEQLIKASRLAANLEVDKSTIRYASSPESLDILCEAYDDGIQTAKLAAYTLSELNTVKQMIELARKQGFIS